MDRSCCCAIFLAGCLVLAPAVVNAQDEDPAPGAEKESKPPEILTEKFLERLDKRLKLTDKQREKIEGILEGSRPGLKKKWDQVQKLRKEMKDLQKGLQETMRKTSEKIRSELDYGQQDRYDMMRMRMRRRMEQRGTPRGMQPPGPPGMDGRGQEDFPPEPGSPMGGPEMWHGGPPGGRGGLPPEIQERIRERRQRRMKMGPGSQRDVPPVDQRNDRRRHPAFDPDEAPPEGE
ncbi:MAG: hypothetical protein ABII00_14495 [Elusimicrobiota bacterium]